VTLFVSIPEPVILVSGVALIVACGCAGIATILGRQPRTRASRRHAIPLIEHEKDVAAALGWPWRRWIALRAGVAIIGALIGFTTQIWLLSLLLGAIGFFGVRFLVAGRAARRRLRMERAFLAQLRSLRDRMAIGNQSLDSALQEVGRNPGRDLVYVLAPWAQGGSVTGNLVLSGLRSRSPLVEHACAVLIWARTRSLDGLISAIDDVLLPVGEAQLQVEEESLVTLTQQRAVTFAMSALMTVMFLSLVRVASFRAYYDTFEGTVVLLLAVAMFFALIAMLGRIARTARWTRWDLRQVQEQELHPHG
jgi:Flp pilus assembly protein TadB